MSASSIFSYLALARKTLGFRFLNNTLLTLGLLVGLGYTSTAYSAISIVTEAKWTVFETDSFRIHYTAEYRDWAISAAHDMEAAAKTVKDHQNRDLKMKVDVVVFDPFNDSNGFAIPFSNKPIMALFATPPQSDSIISNSSSWQQLLSLHEYVHLVHIGQPSRQSFKQSLSKYWDLYDIYKSSGMPRWVTEGYATLLESKLTGRGRLFDVQVEAMLLQFAREGALPKYSELSNTSGRYQIGSMAYLVGVRYLSWLEKNYSEETLDSVWTRLRGKKSRSFNDAFKGVFLETPEYLYQRFVAEFTFNALAMQKQLEQTKPTNSSIWLNAEYDMTAPALSPNNKYLAVIESDEDKSIVLNVYQTADNKEAQDDFEKEKVELLENDPVDIGDSAPSVFKRKVEHTLQQTNFSGIRNPRWLDDDHILYGAKTIDSNGMQHQDLFQWQLSTGDVSQLTRHANLRRFDVTPTGKVIAEQTRGGYSGLISFELSQIDGSTLGEAELTKLSEFSLAHIYDFPRINPSDATQLAYLKSTHNQPWSLYITSLSNGTDSALKAMQVNMPKGYQFLSFPEWAADGKSLYFVAGVKDTLKVYEFTLATGQLMAVTHGQTTVSWPIELVQKPETDPDTNQEQQETTRLLNISVQSRGPDIFTQPLIAKNFSNITEFADVKTLSTASNNSDSPIQMPAAKLSADTSIGKEYDYHVKDQDITFVWIGSESSASIGTSEIGIKGSDLLQKTNWDINFLASSRGGLTKGVSANFTYSSLPVKFSAHVYDFELDASEQKNSSALSAESYTGYSVSANLPYLLTHGLLASYQGELSASYNAQEQTLIETTITELRHQQSWYLDKQTWGLTQSSDFTYLEGETDIASLTTTEQWNGSQGALSFGGHIFGIKLTVSEQFAKRNDSSLNLLSLGGVETNIINAKAHSNWLFSPELPFHFQTGNDYKNTTVSLNGRSSSWELYYSAPEMDDVNRAKIIGFKDSASIDMFRSGITNLEIKYGIADVQLDEDGHKIQAWLLGLYRF
ncbi:hypothetical protein GCM10008107_19560 [Psychrosphaera saromensis]|uniref:Peptidase MA-like domain-containing protein n=1 Tax=Psychrosphaera saromensis TaxID=716813 RepID=A0A2S7USD5_9GAMM|nr:hypothetical protein [Psychrosphaera saromensis]PQJ52659.1 hypothetical protein BTO11_02665 [Psychrosphaera saromensis]GHB70294.1 hypothetical protein GCM10008107_19560 [Psychrosphaera saromensis]GLQ13141.1 hypothetical protein GCM10007917_05960 [Psychrosphaera saromensis]